MIPRRSFFSLFAVLFVKAAPAKKAVAPFICGSVDDGFLEGETYAGISHLPPGGFCDIRVRVNGEELPEAQSVDTRTRQVCFILFGSKSQYDTSYPKFSYWSPEDRYDPRLPRPIEHMLDTDPSVVVYQRMMGKNDVLAEGFYVGPFTLYWDDKNGIRRSFEVL